MSDVDNQTLNANNITVPQVYAPLFQDDFDRFILSSGRISGKTSMLVCLWWVYINKYPSNDIVILQATATEIKDSIINEIHKFLFNSGYNVGDEPNCTYYIPKSKKKQLNIKVLQRGKDMEENSKKDLIINYKC